MSIDAIGPSVELLRTLALLSDTGEAAAVARAPANIRSC